MKPQVAPSEGPVESALSRDDVFHILLFLTYPVPTALHSTALHLTAPHSSPCAEHPFPQSSVCSFALNFFRGYTRQNNRFRAPRQPPPVSSFSGAGTCYPDLRSDSSIEPRTTQKKTFNWVCDIHDGPVELATFMAIATNPCSTLRALVFLSRHQSQSFDRSSDRRSSRLD